MKKTIKTLTFFLIVCLILSVAACNSSAKTGEFTLNAKNIEIEVSETFAIQIISKIDKPVTYKSQNESIASVSNNGIVTALKEGITKINVSVEDITQVVRVVVKPLTAKAYAQIVANPESVSIFENDTFTIDAMLMDGDNIVDAALIWKSSNDEILTVNEGVITAKKAGQANIEISALYNGTEIRKIISVNIIKAEIELYPSWDSKQLLKGQSIELECFAINGKDKVDVDSSKVEWTSKNEDIATIKNGKLLGLKKGIATIELKGIIGGETIISEHQIRVREQYTVTFRNEGKTEKTVYVLDGDKINEQYSANLIGYEFKSWMKDGKEFDFETEIQSNLTLDSSWYKSIEILSFNKSASGIVHEWEGLFGGTAVYNDSVIGPYGDKGATEITVKCHEEYSASSNVMKLGSFVISEYEQVTYYLKPYSGKIKWSIKLTDSKPAICSGELIKDEWNKIEIIPNGSIVKVMLNEKLVGENIVWRDFNDYQLSLFNNGGIGNSTKVALSAVYGRFDYQKKLETLQRNLTSPENYIEFLNLFYLYNTEYEQSNKIIPTKVSEWYKKNIAIAYNNSKGAIRPEWEALFGGSVSLNKQVLGPDGDYGATQIKVIKDKDNPNSANVLFLDSLEFNSYDRIVFYLKPDSDIVMGFTETGAKTPICLENLQVNKWNSVEIISKGTTVDIVINGRRLLESFNWKNLNEYKLFLLNTGEIGITAKVYLSAVYGIYNGNAPITPPIDQPITGNDPFENDYLM